MLVYSVCNCVHGDPALSRVNVMCEKSNAVLFVKLYLSTMSVCHRVRRFLNRCSCPQTYISGLEV